MSGVGRVGGSRARGAWATFRRLFDPALVAHLAKIARYWSYAHVEPRRRLTTGPGLRMSPLASLRNGERITLGRDVHVGERCYLWAGDSTGRIFLGDRVLLAPEVFITASNYGVRHGAPIARQERREADVVIGDDVWLGAHVVVLPGVVVGDGTVVGAASVVSRSLPAYCIAVGVPAKVVGWRPGYVPPDDAAPSDATRES